MRGEWQPGMMIDDAGQGLGVGFIADVPRHQPRQLRGTCARARFGHFAQAQIGRIRQDRGEQEYGFFHPLTRLHIQMYIRLIKSFMLGCRGEMIMS